MLLPVVGRDDPERGTMLRTIGPVWDGNEVWLVVAGGATFAAFPAWYATMFSGFYIALLLILFFLIVRVVSFEWRSKSESEGWRSFWTWCNTIGSFGAALVWGVGLANLVYGVPISSDGDYAGNFWDLFNAYTVFAGITLVVLFAFHGATFLTLRTVGEPARPRRARGAAARDPGGRRADGVSRVDSRGLGRQQRQGRLPARASGCDRHCRRRARTRVLLPSP